MTHASANTTARTRIPLPRARQLLLALATIPLALAVACGGASEADPTSDPATVATQALIEEVTTAATSVSTLLNNADVSSDTWRTDAAAALDQLSREVAATAAQLDATEGATERHQQLAAAAVTYSQAASTLADGIETQDLDKLDEAAAMLADATTSLVLAQAAVNN